jgi:hypothetical protein
MPAVYRVGTLLEMVRDMATALALDGKRVKVCVQGAMGQGVFQVGAPHGHYTDRLAFACCISL